MTRVLIADDQALLRGSFRVLVDSAPGLEVVGEASDGVEAVALTRHENPDVVLMDVRMPSMDGIEATRRICASSDVRVLMLTTFDLDEYVYAALRAGASGFLLKDTRPADLLSAIEIVAAGDALLAPSVTRRLVAEFTRLPTGPVKRLDGVTAREQEVLALIARGLSNDEIAARLHVGIATVKTHIGRLLHKLAARDRAQLVIAAYESGLVRPAPHEIGHPSDRRNRAQIECDFPAHEMLSRCWTMNNNLPNSKTLQAYIAKTYFALRWAMALIALLLPLFLLLVGNLTISGPQPDSISGYYHSPLRDVLVGALITTGTFLFLYKIFKRAENLLLNVAGVAAIGVALLPCAVAKGTTGYASDFTFPLGHGICAFVTFACMGVVAFHYAGNTVGMVTDANKQKILRVAYRVIGLAMIALPLLVAILDWLNFVSLFWVETAALWVFGIYWLVKTCEFSLTELETKAVQGTISRPPSEPVSPPPA